MPQCLAGAIVDTHGDELFVGGKRSRLGGDIGPKIAHDVSAFIDVAPVPAQALRIDQVRPGTADREQRALIRFVL